VQRTDQDVDSFLAGLEGDRAGEMRALHGMIVGRMPGHDRHLYTGKLWGGTDQDIIGYGVLDYRNKSGDQVEWFIVGLAEQKGHISMYVNAVVDDHYLLRDYEGRLGKATVGSASISFRSIDDLDLDVLMELVGEAGSAG
jgi:Domain of unknown function (DU1801)